MVEEYLTENSIKNIIILIMLWGAYGPLASFFSNISSDNYASILIFSGIMLLTILSANYAFTYSCTHLKSISERYIGHAIVILIMFCAGLMLEIIAITSRLKFGTSIFALVAILFYLALVLYDFWDLIHEKL